MNDDDAEKREALVEAIFDLKHDLGKYIRLPLAMLPSEATQAEVASAVIQAIDRTRSGPRGVRSVSDLFQAFRSEWEGTLLGVETFGLLCARVTRAIAWRDRAACAETPLDRHEAAGDLTAVNEAIEALLDEVERGAEE